MNRLELINKLTTLGCTYEFKKVEVISRRTFRNVDILKYKHLTLRIFTYTTQNYKRIELCIEDVNILIGYPGSRNYMKAHVKAKEYIEKNKTILKTAEDIEIFNNALNNPPKPNQALIDAQTRYKKSNGK
jgi:hypothetical protein